MEQVQAELASGLVSGCLLFAGVVEWADLVLGRGAKQPWVGNRAMAGWKTWCFFLEEVRSAGFLDGVHGSKAAAGGSCLKECCLSSLSVLLLQ